MDFSDTPEQAVWRAKVREFLAQHWNPEDAALPDLMADQAAAFFDNPVAETWSDLLRREGWNNPTLPKEHGGMGLSPVEQFILREEFTEVGAPFPGGGGAGTAALLIFGTEEQRRERLPRLLAGSERWCQGFSEPGAGSDLAGISTAALRDGDDYIVNGQKIWTSNAHLSDYMWALVRTDKEAPKHRGISMLLIDMHAPGVSIRPIISMPGTHHHNEVFFQDVRVPVSNLIGEENRGWYQAAASLDIERSQIGGTIQMRKYLEIGLRGVPGWSKKAAMRNEIADRWVELSVARLLSLRIISLQAAGSGEVSLASSMAKLYATELKQRIANTMVKLLGLSGMLLGGDNGGHAVHGDLTPLCVPQQYMNSVGATMGGGTSEIQRNVIANRGLGLPRS